MTHYAHVPVSGSSCSSSVAGESDVMSSTSTAGGHSQKHGDDYHFVDGVIAGRAAALASLIRIISSKSSSEKIPNAQLANFYATIFQTLIEKERVMLCTLFYYGRNLFRLGLPGIESLLPHFLFALDIVMIESSKLRLHPSISEVEIRRACLRALSSVICWPTTFGMSKIPRKTRLLFDLPIPFFHRNCRSRRSQVQCGHIPPPAGQNLQNFNVQCSKRDRPYKLAHFSCTVCSSGRGELSVRFGSQ